VSGNHGHDSKSALLICSKPRPSQRKEKILRAWQATPLPAIRAKGAGFYVGVFLVTTGGLVESGSLGRTVVRGIWEESVIFGWGGCWVREWGGSMRAGWSGCPEGGRRKRCEGVGKGELLMVSGCDHYDLWSR